MDLKNVSVLVKENKEPSLVVFQEEGKGEEVSLKFCHACGLRHYEKLTVCPFNNMNIKETKELYEKTKEGYVTANQTNWRKIVDRMAFVVAIAIMLLLPIIYFVTGGASGFNEWTGNNMYIFAFITLLLGVSFFSTLALNGKQSWHEKTVLEDFNDLWQEGRYFNDGKKYFSHQT